jgi:hypothetical protein
MFSFCFFSAQTLWLPVEPGGTFQVDFSLIDKAVRLVQIVGYLA